MSNKNNASNFSQGRLIERGLDEFIGICRGIIFDGIVCYSEAANLLTWLNNNPLVAAQWPAKDIYQQLQVMLVNNRLSDADEAKLLVDLLKITGSPGVMFDGDNPSTQLPLCHPAPTVVFPGRNFVLTGNFKMGPRKWVIQEIEDRGGKVLKDISGNADYLVIGDIGSSAWMHSTHGRKIETAVELRDKGAGIAIVAEAHFMNSFFG